MDIFHLSKIPSPLFYQFPSQNNLFAIPAHLPVWKCIPFKTAYQYLRLQVITSFTI